MRCWPPGSGSAVSDHVPTAALQIYGRYLDGQLEVRGCVWRVGLRRADGDAAEAEPTPGPVTGRLLDGDGAIIIERHTFPAGSSRGDASDIEEPGTFALSLTTDRPADFATLQVEADRQLYEEHIGEPVSVVLGAVPGSLADPLDVDVVTDASPDGASRSCTG